MLGRRSFLRALATASALAVVACASVPDRDPASGCANCPVCLHDGDLACVCVKVATDTPFVEWHGRKWYFCSDECKAAFLANPVHFVPPADVRGPAR